MSEYDCVEERVDNSEISSCVLTPLSSSRDGAPTESVNVCNEVLETKAPLCMDQIHLDISSGSVPLASDQKTVLDSCASPNRESSSESCVAENSAAASEYQEHAYCRPVAEASGHCEIAGGDAGIVREVTEDGASTDTQLPGVDPGDDCQVPADGVGGIASSCEDQEMICDERKQPSQDCSSTSSERVISSEGDPGLISDCCHQAASNGEHSKISADLSENACHSELAGTETSVAADADGENIDDLDLCRTNAHLENNVSDTPTVRATHEEDEGSDILVSHVSHGVIEVSLVECVVDTQAPMNAATDDCMDDDCVVQGESACDDTTSVPVQSCLNIVVDTGHRAVDYSSSSSSSDSSDSESDSSISNVNDDGLDDAASHDDKTTTNNSRVGPLTKGEMTLSDLPPIEHLQINVAEEQCTLIGRVVSVVEVLVVVDSVASAEPLDIDSLLFLERGRRPLGRVYDVMGQVSQPSYCVRFNSEAEIVEFGVAVDEEVFFVPGSQAYTHYVFLQALRQVKGSDASWWDSNEPPEGEVDYSDDEQERIAKRKRGRERHGSDVSSVAVRETADGRGKNAGRKQGNKVRQFNRPQTIRSSVPPPRMNCPQRNPFSSPRPITHNSHVRPQFFSRPGSGVWPDIRFSSQPPPPLPHLCNNLPSVPPPVVAPFANVNSMSPLNHPPPPPSFPSSSGLLFAPHSGHFPGSYQPWPPGVSQTMMHSSGPSASSFMSPPSFTQHPPPYSQCPPLAPRLFSAPQGSFLAQQPRSTSNSLPLDQQPPSTHSFFTH